MQPSNDQATAEADRHRAAGAPSPSAPGRGRIQRWLAGLIGLVVLGSLAEGLVPAAERLGAAARALVVTGAAPQEVTKHKFTHGLHVADAWWKGEYEVAQDCRSCHWFTGEDVKGPGFPDENQCLECHIEGIVEAGNDAPVPRQPRDLTSSFRHYEHLNMECAECHRGPVVTADRLASKELKERLRLVVPENAGSGYCVRCHHDSEGPGDDLFEWSVRDTFVQNPSGGGQMLQATPYAKPRSEMAAVMQSGLSKRQVSTEGFSHAAHVPNFAAGDLALESAACVECHAEIASGSEGASPGSGDAFAETHLRVDQCTVKCHSGATYGLEPASRPSAALATFEHAVHLAPEHGLECSRCHTPDPSSGNFTGPGGGDGTHYRGCIECHTHASLAIEGHGPALLDDCARCHQVDPGAWTPLTAFRDGRPTVEVARPAEATFALGSFEHPLVDGAAVTSTACAECHRNPVAVREPSPDAPFDHSEHLSASVEEAAATDANCLRCHGAIVDQTGPASWSPGDDHGAVALAHLGGSNCADCHGSAARPATLGDLVVERRTRFSHADHLDAGATRCIDCHTPGSGPDVGLKPGAADCTTCHGHGDDSVPLTDRGALDRTQVTSCSTCHGERVPGPEPSASIGRSKLVALTPEFVHNPNDEECSACHQWQPEQLLTQRVGDEPREERESTLWIALIDPPVDQERPFVPHTAAYVPRIRALGEELGVDGLGKWLFELGEGIESQSAGQHCLHCHWNRVSIPTEVTSRCDLGHESSIRSNHGLPILKEEHKTRWKVGVSGIREPKPEKYPE